MEAEFAGKALLMANTMLENARIDAQRKQLYLERVVEPNAADMSRYPKRWFTLLSVFLTVLIGYMIVWLFTVNAREHAA